MTDQPNRDEAGHFLPGHDAGGHPSTFKEEYVEQGRKLAHLGATDSSIADFFGVSMRTVHRWKLAHEEFAEALKVGKKQPDDNVERSLYQCSVGYEYTEQEAIKIKVSATEEKVVIVDVVKHMPANGRDAFTWLKNRRKEEWRDTSQIDHSSSDRSMSPQAPVYNIAEK
jgi:hypothetical protein